MCKRFASKGENFMQDTTLPVRLLPFHFVAASLTSPTKTSTDFCDTITATSDMAILMVQDGTFRVHTQKEVYTLSRGNCLFLNSHQTYQLSNPNRAGAQADLLLFNPDFLFGDFDTVLTDKYLIPFLHSAHCSSFLLPKDNDQFAFGSVFDSIKALLAEKPFAYELSCKELLCKLFRMLLTYSRSLTIAQSTKAAETTKVVASPSSYDITRIKEAMAFFQENYMNPVALEEIADAIHLSTSECCRCFRRTVGATPMEYLNKYRILESIKRIKAGDAIADNISNLAYSVGFNSPSYYNLVFRRYFDCTPSKFKRKFTPALVPMADTEFIAQT
jgi:AraC-like DNA-binding protein